MKSLFAAILLLTSLSAIAQSSINYNGEIINHLDESGNKKGMWKLFDNKNNRMVTCEYENNILVSDIKFFKNGTLVMIKDADGNITLFKDNNIIKVKFITDDSDIIMVDENGNELSEELRKYYWDLNEIMPFYYGGQVELHSFIVSNLDKKLFKRFKGKVNIGFVLDKNGFVTEVNPEGDIDNSMKDEIIRVMKLVPRWQPGFQEKFVKVKYILPLNLK